MAVKVTVVPGSSRKVEQLTGEFDRERRTSTLNRTETRFAPGATPVPRSVGAASSRSRPADAGDRVDSSMPGLCCRLRPDRLRWGPRAGGGIFGVWDDGTPAASASQTSPGVSDATV